MEFIIILIIYGLIIFLDLIPKFKKEEKKEAIVYSVIVLITFIILTLEIIGINFPGPSDLIKNIIKIFA